MSRTIDEKVVSLQFENSNFEKNVKTSMSTLEKFEKSLKLDGAEKGIEKVEKAASKFEMKHMTEEVSGVSKSFNALETIATGVLLNIGSKIGNMTTKLVTSLSGIENVTNGYSKFEQKTSSVQTLLNSTGKDLDTINGYLNTLMRFSDETSYGFTEMASSLAQLTSNGGDIERLIPMITGIANAVAFAGKGPAEFSRAIYNLNQSYSAGALKYMDWKSLELAGVASKDLKKAFIETAVELGKLNEEAMTTSGTIVDIANFSQTLKDNWADVEVMEAAFGKFAQYTQMADEMVSSGEVETYYEAYEILAQTYDDVYLKAAKAAQETKTFNEAVDATKDAVSSVWLTFFETLFGDFTRAKNLWSDLAEDLYDIFVVPGKKMNEVVGGAFKDTYSRLEDVFKKKEFKQAGVTFEDFNDKFLSFLKNSGYKIDDLLEEYGTLRDAFADGNAIITDAKGNTLKLGNVFSFYLNDFTRILDQASGNTSDVADNLGKVQDIFDGIWRGDFGNGEERVQKLADASIDYATAQGLINRLAKEGHRSGYTLIAKDIEYLSASERELLGITPELQDAISEAAKDAENANKPLGELVAEIVGTANRKSGQQLLSETILNLTGIIKNLQATVGTAWSKVFNFNMAEVLYQIVLRIHDFIEGIRNATEESSFLTSIFTVFFQALKLIGQGFKLVSAVVEKLVNAGLTILSKIFGDLSINVDWFADTISEALNKAIDWVKNNQTIMEWAEKAGDALNTAIKNIKEWISNVKQLDSVATFFTGVKTSLEGLASQSFTFDGLLSGYQKVVDKIKNGDKISFKDIGANISNFFTNFRSTITNGLSTTFEAFKLSEDQIKDFQNKLKIFGEYLTGLSFGYLALTTFKKLAESMSGLIAPFKALSDVFSSFAGVGTAIKNYITEMAKNRTINNILKVSIALGIFAASLYALNKVGDSDTLWTTIKQVGALMAIIAAFIAVLTLLGKADIGKGGTITVNLEKFALLISSLGASLLLVALALKVIDGIKTSTLFLGSLVLLTVIAVLANCANMLNADSKFYRSGQSIINDVVGFAIGIYLLAVALKKFDTVEFKHPILTLTSIALFAAAMFFVGVALKRVSGWSALPIIAFTLSLVKVIDVLEKLNKMNTRDYYKGLFRLIPIFAVIFTIMKLAKGLSKEGATFSAVFIVGIAASLYLIGKAMQKLADLDPGELLKGGLAALALFTAVGFIGAGMTRIANVEKGSIKSAIGAAIVIVTSAASIYIMAGAILLFKNIPEEDLKKSVNAIAGVFVALGALFFLIGKGGLFSQGTQAYQAVSALGKIAVIIGVVAVSIAALSAVAHFAPAAFTAAIYGIVAVVGSLTILSLALLTIKSFGDMANKMAAVIVILGSVGTFLYVLSTQIPNADKAIKIAESASKIMLSIAGAILLTSVAAKLCTGLTGVGSVVIGLGGMLSIIMALAGVVAVMEEKGVFNGHLENGLETFVKVMQAIGEALGGLVGYGIGAIITGVTTQLVEAGENLKKFTEAISGLTGLVIPDTFPDTLSKVKDIFVTLGTQQSNIKTISGMKDDIPKLAEFFEAFGGSLVTFSSSIQGINTAKMEAASNAGNMLAALNNSLPNKSNGLLGLLIGNQQTLKDFGKNLEAFGSGLVGLSISLIDFRPWTLEKTLPYVEQLMGIEANLQSGWSLVGWLAGGNNGNKDLGAFGERASAFGDGLAELSKSCMMINVGGIEKAVEVGTMLSDLEASLQSGFSVIGFFEGGSDGNKDLGAFGNRIQEFVAGLVNGLNAFNEIKVSISPDSIRKPLQPFADGKSNFDIVDENVDKLVEIGTKFSELEANLPDDPGVFGNNLKDFGDGLGKFGVGFKEFAENFPSEFPSSDAVQNMIDTVGKVASLSIGTGAEGAGTNAIDAVGQTVSSGIGTLVSGIANFDVTGAASTFQSKVLGIFSLEGVLPDIQTKGSELTNTFLTSATNDINESQARSALDSNISAMANSVVAKSDRMSQMANTGGNWIQGLINGVKSKTNSLYDTIREMADNIPSITKKQLDERSPSHIAYKIGDFFVQGLSNGISDMTEDVVDNAENMALSVSNAVEDALSLSDEMLNYDAYPTVTPVLDMSNISDGAGYINSMLSTSKAYEAILGIEAARAAQTGIQNGQAKQLSVNVNFTINEAGNDLTEADFTRFGNQIANIVNQKLGEMI